MGPVAASARKIAKGALGVIVGGAAVGLAGRAVVRRNRRPTVLGVKIPRGMAARNIKLKMPRGQNALYTEGGLMYAPPMK